MRLTTDSTDTSSDPEQSHWFYWDRPVLHLRGVCTVPRGGNKSEEDYHLPIVIAGILEVDEHQSWVGGVEGAQSGRVVLRHFIE